MKETEYNNLNAKIQIIQDIIIAHQESLEKIAETLRIVESNITNLNDRFVEWDM